MAKKKIVSATVAPAVGGPDPAVISALVGSPAALQAYMGSFTTMVATVTPPKKAIPAPVDKRTGLLMKHLDYDVIPGELVLRITITPKGGYKEEWNPGAYNKAGFFGYEGWVTARDAYFVSPVRKQHLAWCVANGLKQMAK